MPSPAAEEIIANYRKNPGPLLELPSKLPDVDREALIQAADAFSAVEELRITGSRNVDWTHSRFTRLANLLPKLSRLDLSCSHDLSNDGLEAIAQDLTALTYLNLDDCTRVGDEGVQAIAQHLTALTHLDLGGTQVRDMGVKAIAQHLSALTYLDLGGTQVKDEGVKAIAQELSELKYLDLGDTWVTGMSAITKSLFELTHLDFGGTKVLTLPESIGRLRKLKKLVLHRTDLTSLPTALRNLPQLCWLDVRNIPGLKLPEELTSKPDNLRAILDYYFRRMKEGKRTLNEAKLILVGNEAVGKTSLVNYLVHNMPCKDTVKTPGVAIEEGVDATEWGSDTKSGAQDAGEASGVDAGEPKISDIQLHDRDDSVIVTSWKVRETQLKLNVWDFGGQQVLYETHQFFLTARSLYLIVLEARRENTNEQEANLHMWLRSIRARTVDPVPVIVVINKTEPRQELRLDEARLCREFPSIRRFVRTSCRDPKKHEDGGSGIKELRKAIVNVIQESLPHVCDQFPVSYFTIKEQLAKTARKSFILDMEDYRKKCQTVGVTDRVEQENVLALMDCIGVVVKYDETTLLDPNWLTTAVYHILAHDAVRDANGEFVRADLGKLLESLPAQNYPPERWSFIVEMLRRFGLGFELPGHPGRYLLPNQLSVIDPQPPWDDTDALRFRYEYQHTPPRGLLPRFIVQAHQHLAKPRVAWLLGVVLEIQGCPVLVRMDRQERRVDISVRGPKNKRRDALAVVREYFGFVHGLNRFEPGADFTAQVPVPVPGRPDAAFDFEELETYERNKADTIYYKGYDQPFSVKELLAGFGPEPPRRDATAGSYYDQRVINFTNSGTATGVAIAGAEVTADQITTSAEQFALKWNRRASLSINPVPIRNVERADDVNLSAPMRWRLNFRTLREEHPEFKSVWPILEDWFRQHRSKSSNTVAIDELAKDLNDSLTESQLTLLDLLFAIRTMTTEGMLNCRLRLRREGKWLDGDYESLEEISQATPELKRAQGIEVIAIYGWSAIDG